MKKKEIQSWRSKTEQELRVQIGVLEGELVKLSMEFKTGKLKNTRSVGSKRRELAVINTLLREKEIGQTQFSHRKQK